jgi:hypothetical protein
VEDDAFPDDAGHSPQASAPAIPSPEDEAAAGREDAPDASRTVIGSGQKGGQDFRGMEIAYATHLYLLSAEGKLVTYIHGPLSPEQLAKRSVRLVEGNEI